VRCAPDAAVVFAAWESADRQQQLCAHPWVAGTAV